MTSPAGGNRYQQDVGAPGGPRGPKVTSIFDFTEEALEQLAFWLEQRGLHIPVAQILGFSQFTVQAATPVNVQETTTSATFGDLAHAGPSISGLSDGKYLLQWGALLSTSGPNAAYMGVSVNGSVDGTNLLSTLSTALVPGAYATTATLNNVGNNTVTAKYAVQTGGQTGTYHLRWLTALRVSNL